MGNRIVIDPTRIYAWINTTNQWVSASDSASICIPVTVGRSYILQWSDTDSDNVGTIYRYGFSNSDTPSSQTLTQCTRTTPQDASSVTLTADRPYLIIQLSGSKFPDNLAYLVVEEIDLEEVVSGADFFLRRGAMEKEIVLDIDDYVTSGLVFWLDGIKNTRSGHNASASKWEDLTSTHRDMTYNSAAVIGDNYCILNGKSTITRMTSVPTSYTIEVVCDPTSSLQMVMPWRGNNYGTVYFEKSTIMFRASGAGATAVAGILMEQGINTYTARGNSNFRVNGRTATTNNVSRGASSTGNFMSYYTSTYPWVVTTKIYAIRIYNRTLTDLEVLNNSQVDRARFK